MTQHKWYELMDRFLPFTKANVIICLNLDKFKVFLFWVLKNCEPLQLFMKFSSVIVDLLTYSCYLIQSTNEMNYQDR